MKRVACGSARSHWTTHVHTMGSNCGRPRWGPKRVLLWHPRKSSRILHCFFWPMFGTLVSNSLGQARGVVPDFTSFISCALKRLPTGMQVWSEKCFGFTFCSVRRSGTRADAFQFGFTTTKIDKLFNYSLGPCCVKALVLFAHNVVE